MKNSEITRLYKFASHFLIYVALSISPSLAISESAGQRIYPEIKKAIVQLHIGGRNFCTGTLVTPNLIATAAHCFVNQDTKSSYRPEDVSVHFEVKGDRSRLNRTAERLVTHPNYRFNGPPESNLRADIAFLLLDQPVDEDVVTPIPLSGRGLWRERVSILSYQQTLRTTLRIDNDCKVLGANHLTVALSCGVDFGASGAPVIGWSKDHTPSLVSIITAKAMMGKKPVALGAILDEAAVSVFRDASCTTKKLGPC